MTTKTWAEAKALLEERRELLIAWGRYVLFKILRDNGTTHSREVIDTLKVLGITEGYLGKDFWVGAVFSNAKIMKTGETHKHSEKGSHERTNPIWCLKEPYRSNKATAKDDPQMPDHRPLFNELPDDVWSEERFIMLKAAAALGDVYNVEDPGDVNIEAVYDAMKQVTEYLKKTTPKPE